MSAFRKAEDLLVEKPAIELRLRLQQALGIRCD
jgi:hypothetical protein